MATVTMAEAAVLMLNGPMIPNTPPRDLPAVMASHRALRILRLLARDDVPGGRLNDFVLASGLDQVALGGSRAVISQSIRLLEEIGLVTCARNNQLVIVALTAHGLKVAEGRSPAEGVERVWPDCPY